MATHKLKKRALGTPVPQTREDCAQAVARIGVLQREFERARSEMNDGIAQLTLRYQPLLAELAQRIEAEQAAVQVWCEAHRAELLGPGDARGKTADLVTGTVAWRARPPSVVVRAAEQVIERLLRAGLERFVRTRQEVNKEAVLAEPDAVRGIAGITIASGVEDFIITPAELSAQVQP